MSERKSNMKKTRKKELQKEEKRKCLKVRAVQLAASGELAGQLQCLVCNVFASTHDVLQVSHILF